MADRESQVERTALAWRRTTLAVVLNGALVLRLAADRDAAWLWPVGGALLVVALAGSLAVSRRYRRAGGRPVAELLPLRRVGPPLVGLVVAVSAVATVAILTDP